MNGEWANIWEEANRKGMTREETALKSEPKFACDCDRHRNRKQKNEWTWSLPIFPSEDTGVKKTKQLLISFDLKLALQERLNKTDVYSKKH